MNIQFGTLDLQFIIPGTFPSLNVLLKWHWAKRARHRQEIERSIRFATSCWHPPPRRKRRARVDLTIYQPYRRLDQDNAEGAMKPVIDSLRALGLIYQDSPDWLDKTIVQFVDRKNPRLEITISYNAKSVRETGRK